MINFENVEELVDCMFENCEDQTVSVIANKDVVTDILKELLCYKDTDVDICELDSDEEYDREYTVILHKDPNADKWTFGVEKIYLEDQDKYISTGDYVLFHEDVNSKALIDAQNNEYMPLRDHDWFTVGEEESEDTDENDTDKEIDSDDDDHEGDFDDPDYSVIIKVGLDSEEAEDLIRDMQKNFQREFSDMFDMLYRPYLYEYHPRIKFFW